MAAAPRPGAHGGGGGVDEEQVVLLPPAAVDAATLPPTPPASNPASPPSTPRSGSGDEEAVGAAVLRAHAAAALYDAVKSMAINTLLWLFFTNFLLSLGVPWRDSARVLLRDGLDTTLLVCLAISGANAHNPPCCYGFRRLHVVFVWAKVRAVVFAVLLGLSLWQPLAAYTVLSLVRYFGLAMLHNRLATFAYVACVAGPVAEHATATPTTVLPGDTVVPATVVALPPRRMGFNV